MKAVHRYLLILCCGLALMAFYLGGGHPFKRRRQKRPAASPALPPSPPPAALAWLGRQPHFEVDVHPAAKSVDDDANAPPLPCRMETCFDFSLCSRGPPYLHYVYPGWEDLDRDPLGPPHLSTSYRKILNVLLTSPLATDDPDRACLFVVALDTLDRDNKSANYLPDLSARLARLPLWNGGRNHVVFNLYSDTYPTYSERLDFDVGRAILAQASLSHRSFRPGYDVSLPLFHAGHPERDGATGWLDANRFPVARPHLLTFKGKRYVYGIGSETRNSLFHLHNGRDLVLLTTCKHNKDWQEKQDQRCDQDNKEYDRWDFNSLLSNSTFCLVPRGRRLGSFRFIETLQAGCVPVVLANQWRLPFTEVIDWPSAAVLGDERLLTQVAETLRDIPHRRLFAMRQQAQVVWDNYLSSVDKIVATTLEIIHSRIAQHLPIDGQVWNTYPGALVAPRPLSSSSACSPFAAAPSPASPFSSSSVIISNASVSSDGDDPSLLFTAVIYTRFTCSTMTSSGLKQSSPLFRLVRAAFDSSLADRVVVLWACPEPPPPKAHWPRSRRRGSGRGRLTKSTLDILVVDAGDPSARFRPRPQHVHTDCVLSLDDDASLTADEMRFAFGVWRHFPDRIVGFAARTHHWDSKAKRWRYSSKWTNDYSMVLAGSAFYHRHYHHLYTNWLSPRAREIVRQVEGGCEHVLMNMLVTQVTQRTPVKVTQRKRHKEEPAGGDGDFAAAAAALTRLHACINNLVIFFGHLPLKKSSLRMDPVLYKDPVSNTRKKYKKLELIPN